MPPFYVNPNIFVLFNPEGFILWNYETHEQFVVKENYISRIQQHQLGTAKESPAFEELDQTLEATGVIQRKPYDKDDWEWDILSKIFHIGTQNVPNIECSKVASEWLEARIAHNKEAIEKFSGLYVQKEGPRITLPPVDFQSLEEITLLKTLKERKTCREFFPEALDIKELSTLLFTAFGRFHGESEELKELNLEDFCLRKTSPSGGGIHPTEAYLVAFNVTGLKPGIYHYTVFDHTLTQVNTEVSQETFLDIMQEQFYLKNIGAGIFLTSCFFKIWGKYPHSRAYRVALLDMGHVAQIAQLVATSLKIKTWISAAFKDAAASKLLHLDSHSESPLLFIGLGHGSNEMLPQSIKALLKGN
jgi:SagB-type dehydrogenase family enzyme